MCGKDRQYHITSETKLCCKFGCQILHNSPVTASRRMVSLCGRVMEGERGKETESEEARGDREREANIEKNTEQERGCLSEGASLCGRAME